MYDTLIWRYSDQIKSLGLGDYVASCETHYSSGARAPNNVVNISDINKASSLVHRFAPLFGWPTVTALDCEHLRLRYNSFLSRAPQEEMAVPESWSFDGQNMLLVHAKMGVRLTLIPRFVLKLCAYLWTTSVSGTCPNAPTSQILVEPFKLRSRDV